MDARPEERPAPDGAQALFLVEFPTAAAGEAEDMHVAFQHAVLRLRTQGAPIRWCEGWLVAERRCLCLVEAPGRAAVVLARDTAALTAAAVHPVRPLPARTLPSPTRRTRGRS